MPDLLTRFRLRRRPPGMTCRELVELVTDYLEGALSPLDRARFEAHIEPCNDCTAYVHQMRETLVLLGTLPVDELSPQVESELRAAFREWKADSAQS
jgi:anti-sigma factor RsiW